MGRKEAYFCDVCRKDYKKEDLFSFEYGLTIKEVGYGGTAYRPFNEMYEHVCSDCAAKIYDGIEEAIEDIRRRA